MIAGGKMKIGIGENCNKAQRLKNAFLRVIISCQSAASMFAMGKMNLRGGGRKGGGCDRHAPDTHVRIRTLWIISEYKPYFPRRRT